MNEKDRTEKIESNIGIVYMVVLNMCRDDQEFDDMVGYGRIGLIRAVDSWKETSDGEFVSYAYQAVKNSILNAIKREKRHIFEQERDVASAYSFEREVESRQEFEIIMGELTAQERKLVQLRHIEGYNLTEISGITGLKLNTIKQYLYNIRKKAKKKRQQMR